jgi:hypothetical protein
VKTFSDLIAYLRTQRANLAAASQNLTDESDDPTEIMDALDDTITFLLERDRTKRRAQQ